jgi:D-tyrosyl-tRNA(Tyr) deacylase
MMGALPERLVLNTLGTPPRMKAVIQRVSEARVEVEGRVTGAIGTGLLILLGVEQGDTAGDAAMLAKKICELRIFADANGKMNLSLEEINGGALVVSQFTLCADTSKGRRPSYSRAAPPETANDLYKLFAHELRKRGMMVATGVFQARMRVSLVNDGPVTLLCESPRRRDAIQESD